MFFPLNQEFPGELALVLEYNFLHNKALSTHPFVGVSYQVVLVDHQGDSFENGVGSPGCVIGGSHIGTDREDKMSLLFWDRIIELDEGGFVVIRENCEEFVMGEISNCGNHF